MTKNSKQKQQLRHKEINWT